MVMVPMLKLPSFVITTTVYARLATSPWTLMLTFAADWLTTRVAEPCP
jgi:hypothetical protein